MSALLDGLSFAMKPAAIASAKNKSTVIACAAYGANAGRTGFPAFFQRSKIAGQSSYGAPSVWSVAPSVLSDNAGSFITPSAKRLMSARFFGRVSPWTNGLNCSDVASRSRFAKAARHALACWRSTSMNSPALQRPSAFDSSDSSKITPFCSPFCTDRPPPLTT